MKSTVFELNFPSVPNGWQPHMGVTFPIPTLRAYAIEYSEFTCKGGFNEHKEMIEGRDFELTDEGLLWHSPFQPIHISKDYYRLVIHYHGIKDYSLLFPHIQSRALQERLGHFYEEADVSFENRAWLAFALMCGALYEGLLFHYFDEKDKKFEKLINDARTAEIIDDGIAKIMHSTRGLRNLVHASRLSEPYVERAQAMDMRRVLDRLIKDAAYWQRKAVRSS